MRAVVSRVTEAAVLVDDQVVGELDRPGLLVLLGITHDDGPAQAEMMARKLHELRILRDERSIADTDAGVLVVSQFTLTGRLAKAGDPRSLRPPGRSRPNRWSTRSSPGSRPAAPLWLPAASGQ